MQENGIDLSELILYKIKMKRIYSEIIQEHLRRNRQMIFIAGPRQVGKTTVARLAQGEHGCYVNWAGCNGNSLWPCFTEEGKDPHSF